MKDDASPSPVYIGSKTLITLASSPCRGQHEALTLIQLQRCGQSSNSIKIPTKITLRASNPYVMLWQRNGERFHFYEVFCLS